MATKLLQFDQEALNSLVHGVRKLAKAVIVTLGPKGRNVVIKRGAAAPLSTKDGVTVAKEISLKDKFENMGAQLVKEVASKTADVAGDGTTTAIVLAQAIFTEGVKHVAAGINPMSLKRGIDRAVDAMLTALTEISQPVKSSQEILQIATISANNDLTIGRIIADAMEKVGKDGVITVGEAKGLETELDVVEGLQFDKGYLSPYFVTNQEKMSVELDNCLVLLCDKKISNVKDLVPILEKVMEKGARPFLIIAEDVDGEALSTLVLNKLQGGLPLCCVKAPGFGDQRKAFLQDIAILTGATVISDEVGLHLEDADLAALGGVKKVKVTKETTTLVEGGGQKKHIEARAAQIRQELANSTSSFDREKLEKRLANIAGGVAVINLGAASETELNEKKARVEDALHATRAAVAGGIVPGGGVALLRAARTLDHLKGSQDELVGIQLIKQAAFTPAAAIAENCGKRGALIAEKIFEQEDAWGYNGMHDRFEDLIEAGVTDPVLVTKSALAHAASIAGLLLTTAAMITEKPQPKSASPAPDMGGMGGMGDMMM